MRIALTPEEKRARHAAAQRRWRAKNVENARAATKRWRSTDRGRDWSSAYNIKHRRGQCGARIYALVDPRDGAIRYVGQTTQGLARRRGMHLSHARRGQDADSKRGRWLTELMSLGLQPGIVLIEECDPADLDRREDYWITALFLGGADLLNRNLDVAALPVCPSDVLHRGRVIA